MAYQIQLKEISKDNESRQQFEDFVAADEQSQQDIILGENEIATTQDTTENNGEVSQQPTERKKHEPKQQEGNIAEKKADIEKRRNYELKNQEDYLQEQYTIGSNETVEQHINAKYDAELLILLGSHKAEQQKANIEKKIQETESKIKNKGLFLSGVDENGNRTQSVGEIISQSDVAPVPTSVREVNGIEFVEFSNPKTGLVDVIVTGTSENDYVGYYRLYENGKPTNRWSSKLENQSRNKENYKTMISGVQKMLPDGHEYTEKTSISADGLRMWGQQLDRGYEVQRDKDGNVVTNRVAINGDAIDNELGIPVSRGNFENISVRNKKDMDSVRKALKPYLEKLGLSENNIHFENGSAYIDLPVLKQKGNQSQTKTEDNATSRQQSKPLRTESQQQQAERTSDSDMPEGNQAVVQDREATSEEEVKPKRKVKITSLEQLNDELRDIFALDSLSRGLSLQKIIENAKGFFKSGQPYNRFHAEEQGGLQEGGRIHVEASVITGRDGKAGETQDARADRQERDIKKYAQEEGVWHKNTDKHLSSQYGEPIAQVVNCFQIIM